MADRERWAMRLNVLIVLVGIAAMAYEVYVWLTCPAAGWTLHQTMFWFNCVRHP